MSNPKKPVARAITWKKDGVDRQEWILINPTARKRDVLITVPKRPRKALFVSDSEEGLWTITSLYGPKLAAKVSQHINAATDKTASRLTGNDKSPRTVVRRVRIAPRAARIT